MLRCTRSNGASRPAWVVAHAGGIAEVVDRDPARTRRQTVAQPLAGLPVSQEQGNLEGKELRFGTSAGRCVRGSNDGSNLRLRQLHAR